MTHTPGNPPAFPLLIEEEGCATQVNPGMSLRDYFAGQALAEMIRLTQHHDGGWDPVAVAAGCYDMADAMLKARGVQS